jgi:hypothetical protein
MKCNWQSMKFLCYGWKKDVHKWTSFGEQQAKMNEIFWFA